VTGGIYLKKRNGMISSYEIRRKSLKIKEPKGQEKEGEML
jgi:hypothetical protein